MIRRFIAPPVFEKEEDNFRARFINGFAWIVTFVLSIVVISDGIDISFISQDLIFLGLIGVQGLALFFLRRRKINTSGLTIVVLSWIGVTIQAISNDGIRNPVIVAYVAIALLASIVVNITASTAVIVTSIGTIWAFVFLDANGYISANAPQSFDHAKDLSFIFVVITSLIYFSTTNLMNAIARANKSEENLLKSNQELQTINQTLEDRVSERTADLESANQRNEKRAKQLEALAQVARATTTNESLDSLLPRLVSLVSDQFGFYHTGIFLLDENRTHAVLSAANSEGGKKMLQRGHKLQIGQTGIVGFVSAMGKPRIALDVGSDAVFFDNPDLPNTRSEMALPLSIANEIIGVLDVQSTEEKAFHENDIEILSTLADQVAIAIQNSRTYQTMQELLEKAQRESGAYLQDAWRVLESEQSTLGYRVSEQEVVSLINPLSSPQVERAVKNKQTVAEHGTTATLAVPIRLRNEIIGVIDIRTSEEHDWDEDEIDIAEAVADRLSLALESSLLLKSTQRQAEIERVTAAISDKIGATTQFDSILRTAAEELSRALGGSDVLVQLHHDDIQREEQ